MSLVGSCKSDGPGRSQLTGPCGLKPIYQVDTDMLHSDESSVALESGAGQTGAQRQRYKINLQGRLRRQEKGKRRHLESDDYLNNCFSVKTMVSGSFRQLEGCA